MSGFPVLPLPTGGRLSVPSRQYYRSASGSPTRQKHYQHHVDMLISQLAPATALQALRFPTGPLKDCLDTATASEQSFAMQAALASSSIQEWLDELSKWPWPEDGGPAGFEQPASSSRGRQATRRSSVPSSPKPTTPAAPVTPERQITRTLDPFGGDAEDPVAVADNDLWMGSLPAADVARYEERVAEIQREIDDLDVEDLKRRVLHHHILPLSPPTTPSFAGRKRRLSSASVGGFTKMDDLTAVVTALVLQALPLLSKLVRLLNTWHIRILVLKKVPTLLDAIGDAEAAIRSAWNALCLGSVRSGVQGTSHAMRALEETDLRQDEFSAIKSVVEQKVSKAAQIIDYMLDVLDGWEDTVPDHLIDRIDAAERDYGEWVAVCERRIRDSEYRRALFAQPTSTSSSPPRPGLAVTALAAVAAAKSEDLPALQPAEETAEQQSRSVAPGLAIREDILVSTDAPEQARSIDGFKTPPSLSPRSSSESLRSEPSLPPMPRAAIENGSSTGSPSVWLASDGMTPIEKHIADEVLVPSDIINDIPDDDDVDVVSSPPVVLCGPFDEDRSPSSSPPNFRASVRSTVTFNDMPTVTEIPGEESPDAPKAPGGPCFVLNDDDDDELDMSQDMGSPSSRRMSVGSEDDQLQQQISEILESIPARIRLASQPALPLNYLNPPDFKIPRRPKAPSENGRSTSSLSSRSTTPSFLLAPAYARTLRSRQRSNQEIKLYHLSRSTGEAPIKLFIRCVGESGERVMVRVGGGWADLSEYLKEYASHHSRRSKSGTESRIEVRDLPSTVSTTLAGSRCTSRAGSSPPSRPASALDSPMSMSPLLVRKTRRSVGEESGKNPRTPLAALIKPETPSSGASTQSRSSSRLSWTEEDSTLGMSGPRSKNIEMSEESKAWMESVKEKVRIASGERRVSDQAEGKFGEMGKVGGTKRLFRKG